MPWDEPSDRDPMIRKGMAVPAGEETFRGMAAVFVEEFLRLGFDEEGLLDLFRNPFYRGPHGAYRRLGEKAIRGIISERTALSGCGKHTSREGDPRKED